MYSSAATTQESLEWPLHSYKVHTLCLWVSSTFLSVPGFTGQSKGHGRDGVLMADLVLRMARIAIYYKLGRFYANHYCDDECYFLLPTLPSIPKTFHLLLYSSLYSPVLLFNPECSFTCLSVFSSVYIPFVLSHCANDN